MKKVLPIVVTLLYLSFASFAQASDEKVKAAQRFLAASPVSELFDKVVPQLALQIPESQRESYIRKMTSEETIKKVELAAMEAMTNTFTLDELNAMADFYGSDIGKSVMSKMDVYSRHVMNALQEVMVEATI